MLDERGFTRKTYEDLLEDLEQRARELFGENINTRATTPLGILLRIWAWALSIVWMTLEKVYHSQFPSTATGVSLDRAVKTKGIFRFRAQFASGMLEVTGEPAGFVPYGFKVSTPSGIVFETVEEVTLDETGRAVVEVYAVEAGQKGNVGVGEITVIEEPIEQVHSVRNIEPTANGRDLETDAELYARYESTAESGSSSNESIRATLLEVPGVRDVTVTSNDLHIEKDGLPPHCIAPFVFGGDDNDVARAILQTKAGGIQSFGSTVLDIADSMGNRHKIGFSRPVTIDIYVRAKLETNPQFTSNGISAVRSAILDYIGGDGLGTTYTGLGLGENVVHNRLVSRIMGIEGVADVMVEMRTADQEFKQGNIIVPVGSVAKTAHEKVEII